MNTNLSWKKPNLNFLTDSLMKLCEFEICKLEILQRIDNCNWHVYWNVKIKFDDYWFWYESCMSKCNCKTNRFWDLAVAIKETERSKVVGKKQLRDGELNPGLPRDRRGYSPLYYLGSRAIIAQDRDFKQLAFIEHWRSSLRLRLFSLHAPTKLWLYHQIESKENTRIDEPAMNNSAWLLDSIDASCLSKKARIPATKIRDSIVVSIPACHAGDRGSIPRLGVCFWNMTWIFIDWMRVTFPGVFHLLKLQIWAKYGVCSPLA